jgi:hypothetical protein
MCLAFLPFSSKQDNPSTEFPSFKSMGGGYDIIIVNKTEGIRASSSAGGSQPGGSKSTCRSFLLS